MAVDWFLPAFRAGGPIRSVANLAELLSGTHDIWIVAGAYDLGTDKTLDVVLNTWVQMELNEKKVQVMYLTRDRWTRNSWDAIFDKVTPQWLYLNSLFSKAFMRIPLRLSHRMTEMRVVLAPRGMLGERALAIKPLKKRVFLAYARTMNLFRNVRWHASSIQEKSEIQNQFHRAEVCIAQNVAGNPNSVDSNRPTDHWSILVVGRIHRVKNLHFGLCALLTAPTDRPLRLVFVGPVEDVAYMNELEEMVRNQSRVEVDFIGGVPQDGLAEYFNAAHFLLSPTRQENFGHSIVEAWGHGCPVFISDQTPWRGLEKEGIGWDWPLDEAVWVDGMEQALSMTIDRWSRLSENAKCYFYDVVRGPHVMKSNRKIFES